MGRAFTVQNDTTVITNNFNPAFIFCPRPSKGALTETSRSIHMIHCACLKAWVLATPVPIPSQATRPSFAPSPACCTPSTRLVFAHCLLLTPDSFFGWALVRWQRTLGRPVPSPWQALFLRWMCIGWEQGWNVCFCHLWLGVHVFFSGLGWVGCSHLSSHSHSRW